MELRYKLDGTGWATLTISEDEKSVEVTVSYLHDSLKELDQAVLAIGRGELQAEVVFMDEPGEHHLLFIQETRGTVSFELRWFDHWVSCGHGNTADFREILKGTISVADLKAQTVSALKEILDTFGVEGYKAKWVEHDFPISEFDLLRAS